MDFKSILQKIDSSLLSEEVAKEISNAFETAVNEKADTKVSLQLEKALMEQDDEHAAKLEKLLEAIDSDHCEKLKNVVNAINENHTEKLNNLSNFYKKALNEKAEAFSNKIINEISNYLDLYLDKKIPTAQLEEAVNNINAKKQLNDIRKIIGIDSSYVNKEVKNTISEGKKAIDDLNKKITTLNEENKNLVSKVKTIETNMILEERTRNMSNAKKDFIVKLLSDKSKDYINENFNYVVEMFDTSEEEKTSILADNAKQNAITRKAGVPASTVISESSTNTNPKNTLVGGYLSELKKTEGFSNK
jgi:hypothetical protein